ncbi:unnamed protein product [Calypogeia fissa]
MTDYYKILGIDKNASASEVKSAFRKLAFKHHPDKHANASEHYREASSQRFKELAEAYEVLSDEKKRNLYNKAGRAGPGFQYGSNSTTHGAYRHARGAYAQGPYRGGGDGGFHPGSSRRTASPYRWNFSFGFGRADYIFHGLIFTMAIIGFTSGGSAAEALWKMRNSGRSFEETIEVVERRKQEQITRDQTRTSPPPKEDQLEGKT